MKAHIGVDTAPGLVHTVIGTADNVADVTQAHAPLHGGEIAALGDTGHQGVEKHEENQGKSVTWHVAMRRAKHRALPKKQAGAYTCEVRNSQSQRTGESGASTSCREVAVQVSQDALPRLVGFAVWICQSAARWQTFYDL